MTNSGRASSPDPLVIDHWSFVIGHFEVLEAVVTFALEGNLRLWIPENIRTSKEVDESLGKVTNSENDK
jgi:hypothetical protein